MALTGGAGGDPDDRAGMRNQGKDGGEGDDKEGIKTGAPDGALHNFNAEEEYKKLEDMIDENEIMKRISHLLNKTKSFELSKRKKLIPDAYGTTLRTRGIDEISEIPKLRQAELAHLFSEYGVVRIISGEAQVREWCFEEVPKKRYYLLIDASGSMKEEGDNPLKIQKALGVAYTLLKRVLKLDVVVDLAFFSTTITEFREVSDPDSVHAAIEYINSCAFDGGGTNICNSLDAVFEHMKHVKTDAKELEVKDIVLITDGEDSETAALHYSKFRQEHARLHYVEVNPGKVGSRNSAFNPRLQEIAVQTGGFSACY
jgi:uncharacterized protein with von Willebrand factor type A (vWA) domain